MNKGKSNDTSDHSADQSPQTSRKTINIHGIIRNGLNDNLRTMLDRGADPNQKNSKGATPLLVATTYKNIEAVKILLEHGADPNITNDIFLIILLEHGSTMNIGNRLALQFAARRERGFCCQILMNFGADRDKKDPNGKTAFSIAYEKKDPLPELILGSESNIPTVKNEMDIILELNDLIKKENADLWSNFDLDPTPHDDDDFRFFLKSLSALERRMKRFDQFLEIQLKNYEENLNSIHENLQSNDPELEKLKQDILSQFDAKLKRSFEVQKNIQKDLYTPNGSEALHRWNNVIKERMQFIIDLVAHADNNSEETIKEYKRNKICYDRIKSIHSANNEKVKSLDQKIRSYLYNLPRLSSETAKIVNNLNAQLDGPLYIESRTSTSPMPSQRVSKSNRA